MKKIFPILCTPSPRPSLCARRRKLCDAVRSMGRHCTWVLCTLVLLTGCSLFHRVPSPLENKGPELVTAVVAEDLTQVNNLLNQGASMDYHDSNGKTALHYAAQIDNTQILQALLQAGAEVDVVDKYGKTPSMDAARLGLVSNLKLLVDHGASLTAVDKYKRSLMIFAASAPQGSLQTVKWLESKGVSIRHGDKNRNTPISTAIDKRNLDTASYLMKIFPKDLKTDRAAMLIALHTMRHAIFANNQVIVKQLLNANIMLNNDPTSIYKMLKAAQIENWIGTAASTGIVDNPRMPLSWAAEADNLEIIQLLIANGASTTCKDAHGLTAVDYAKSIEVIRYLRKVEKQELKNEK